jgi:hypothetical protein
MYPDLLALSIIVIIFFISTFIFSGIYYTYNKNSDLDYERNFGYSVYFSFTIQTIVGLAQPTTVNQQGLQIWVMVQSFISYIIGIGLIFILVKIWCKNHISTSIKGY